MHQSIQLRKTIPAVTNSLNRSLLRRGFLLLALAWFVLSPPARAVTPPPDGDYGGENTAEGAGALQNLITGGFGNTAIGYGALYSNTTGSDNTAVGSDALANNTTGSANTANGEIALASNTTGFNNTASGYFALNTNSTGSSNTANGVNALYNNTTGNNNTANGVNALYSNTTGFENTATGVGALQSNTTGADNTANGVRALSNNSTGNANTADGVNALLSNTTGFLNTANGVNALQQNTTGNFNTANGASALTSNTTGGSNTATGFDALGRNTTGGDNTASGYFALGANTTGDNNTANGDSALQKNTIGNNNTACGVSALHSNTTGGNNVALGYQAGSALTTGSNNIDIGALGGAGESNTIRIGKINVQKTTYIQGISGATVANGVPVRVDSAGHLGTATSSARFKEAIEPMNDTSEALLALKPVTFRYKHELDPDGVPQFGLVAEEVEKVNPALVVRDADGKVNTVRYEAVNAMLLNEFLKEHRKVEEQEARLGKQDAMIAGLKDHFQTTIAQQQKQIETLTAGLQKVNDQVQLRAPIATVATNQR